MNEKDTKVPVYLAIIIALILVAAAGYYVLGGKPGEEEDGVTPIETPENTPAATHPGGTPQVSATAAPPQTSVATIKCELCHTDAQNLEPHMNGGKLCINCHGSQVHSIHIGSGTIDLNCDSCHGFPPKIPTVEKGDGPGHFSVCEQCHAAPPDNLKPSNGNLVIIHLSRAKYCTNCHGTDVAKTHAAALGNKTAK
ncbi:MAG: hypothetical protein Q7J35_05570 [Candidatus Methanoperedens sp.]|nr:hypothetical protein [Candidatus Methanoperedens sp.]